VRHTGVVVSVGDLLVERLESVDDPRLHDYSRLRDVNLRKLLEPAGGLFIAEGEKVIRRALAAGYPARSFLMTERWLEGLRDVIAPGVPCYILSDAQLAQVAGFRVHRGALASMHRLPLPSMEQVVKDARLIVVLEDVVDHTNVGAIFRNAAAFGVDAVVLAPRCADPLYRRAVRTSMGAVFTMPYARMPSWYHGLAALRDLGFGVVALTPAADAVPIESCVGRFERTALLLGSEGDGLSDRWLAEADLRARIPIAAGIDSLNVAAAAAVACYVLGGSGGRSSGQSPHSPPPGTR